LLGSVVTELLIVATGNLIGFGDRVRKAREAAGFSTQKKLADALGIAQGTVGNWESGENTPTLIQTVELARALRIPVDYLTSNEPIPAFGMALEATLRAIVRDELSNAGVLRSAKQSALKLNHLIAAQAQEKPESGGQ
jgi:transcriptional regulator with XRE-family HTH domain